MDFVSTSSCMWHVFHKGVLRDNHMADVLDARDMIVMSVLFCTMHFSGLVI